MGGTNVTLARNSQGEIPFTNFHRLPKTISLCCTDTNLSAVHEIDSGASLLN